MKRLLTLLTCTLLSVIVFAQGEKPSIVPLDYLFSNFNLNAGGNGSVVSFTYERHLANSEYAHLLLSVGFGYSLQSDETFLFWTSEVPKHNLSMPIVGTVLIGRRRHLCELSAFYTFSTPANQADIGFMMGYRFQPENRNKLNFSVGLHLNIADELPFSDIQYTSPVYFRVGKHFKL